MADARLSNLDTSKIPVAGIGQMVDQLMIYNREIRRGFERRWYDNNFFDDGFHYRYLSRTTNKIVDLSERASIYGPQRAIPKASRQIRGVANLLVSQDYTPVIYPEKINQTAFNNPQEYQMAVEMAKTMAKNVGHWVQEEWNNQDFIEKLAFMIILTAKHGISYLQIWPDSVKEAIKTQVYDAFDIYLMGNLTEIEDSPFIIKAIPMLVSEIKANEDYDEEQLAKISPDNKQASSEIKEAYMKARYGAESRSDAAVTLILKEAYLKEYVNEENMARIRLQENGDQVLQGKKEGDPIIRQVFVAGDVWLKDTYTKLPGYPFVDYRMEPGNIYQVPLIERFIPANKSLDAAVSRVERFFHTMVTGTWLKRQGEQFNITNVAGGQTIEYQGTPPVQAAFASPGQFPFAFMQLLTQLIEEQGVTTSTLGKIPQGVKANAAIESLKESEYANLVIAQRRLKNTVKRIAEKMMDIADNYFVSPQTVYFLEKGEPQYFDIIGKSALDKRRELKVETDPNVIPISKEYRVEIEVQQGSAFTREGRQERMKQLMVEILLPLAQQGYVNPEAVKVAINKALEDYQFGATAEFMEAFEKTAGMANFTDQQLMAMKVSVLEALKEAGEIGPAAEKKRILETKIGAVEALRDTGIIEKQVPKDEKGPSKSISFKDLPPDGKVQLAAQAGIQLDPQEVASDEAQDLVMQAQEMQLKQVQHQQKMSQQVEQMSMKESLTDRQLRLQDKKMTKQERLMDKHPQMREKQNAVSK